MLLPATTDIMIKTKKKYLFDNVDHWATIRKKWVFLKATDLQKDVTHFYFISHDKKIKLMLTRR